MLTQRHLVTTAQERSWKFDRPVLFLGEWCKRYDRKHIWESMDALVAEPFGVESSRKIADIECVQKVAGQLLNELASALNAFHGMHHDTRYWNIVLGHWLQRYVAVIFNRYFTLEKALQAYSVSGATVWEGEEYSLATIDSMSFVWACNDDFWNYALYSKIIKALGRITTESDSEPQGNLKFFSLEQDNSYARRKGLKSALRAVINGFQAILCRKDDAFIIESYLSRKNDFVLQLSLRQWPQRWCSPLPNAVIPDLEKRGSFKLDPNTYQGFERAVRVLLPDIIPTCYLEGFASLKEQAQALPWPSRPKFIYTSNNFDTDEIFKTWTASQVEKGRPYFVGQHGNNYGTHIYLGNQFWPENQSSDRFFTWGWTDEDPKNVPAFVFTIAGRKPPRMAPDGGLLLQELHPPHWFGPEDSHFEFEIYQEEQFRFVECLPEEIQNALTVRLHPGHRDFRYFNRMRWKDRSPKTRIEPGEASLQALITRSRLIVQSYDSTGNLEGLAQNIPTLCFWHGGLTHVLPSAKPYYELLRKGGILLGTPEEAAEAVARHWDNISEWWRSDKVQDARKAFCERYARTEKRPVQTMKRLLTSCANEAHAEWASP